MNNEISKKPCVTFDAGLLSEKKSILAISEVDIRVISEMDISLLFFQSF